MFDKRGTGMSDRVGLANLETRMDDVRAVLDASGAERAALFGVSEGGPMCVLFAATYPERTLALVLFASFARTAWAPDYPCGETDEAWRAELDELERRAGDPRYFDGIAAELAPSADATSKRKFADMMRQSG